jgi:hypothetical protein
MRAPPEELYLQNLEEHWPVGSFWYMPKDKAREELKKLIGVDAAAWRNWIKEKKWKAVKQV